MGSKIQETRSALAWALAEQQHGVVTRRDLLGLGFSAKSIRHRLGNGRLHRLAPGVYSVGRPGLIAPEARWMAAVLACGDGAILSHRSAAALWSIGRELPGRIDVSIRRRSDLRRRGIRVCRRETLSPREIGRHKGIPVTRPVQTLIDIATDVTPRELERAVNEADKRDRVDPETLRAALDGRAGQPGVRLLRDLLDRHTFRLSDDELELLFRPLAAEAGLPMPLTKQIVNDYEVDFFWPDLGLVVETDGLRYHRTASSQTRDARRDQTHTAAGFTPLRFSHYQVKYEPTHVRSILARTRLRLER
jgi:predicted transcriptional regulator of viral defense system